MEPILLDIVTSSLPFYFMDFIRPLSSGRMRSSQRSPFIFQPPHLNQAPSSIGNVPSCLYLLKSEVFSRFDKNAALSYLASHELFAHHPHSQISRAQIRSSLSYFIFLLHFLLCCSDLCTGLIVPIRFQVLGDGDDDNNYNNNHQQPP